MGQTGGFAASSWLVRQVARSKQEQKSCYLTGIKRIKGIGRYNKTSSFRFDLICVHQVLSVFDNDFALRVDHSFTPLLISVNSVCSVIASLISVYHVNQRPIDSFLLLQTGPCLII